MTPSTARRPLPSVLFLAVIASAAVVVSAAYVVDVSRALQAAFPGWYRNVVGGLVIAAIAAAIAGVAARIRENRARRFGALALAVAGAAAYFAAFRTGNADVDVVEAFHFVEYGALAILFHRAWRHRDDARRLVFPVVAGLATGVLDESLQWFLASRVGEAHDVFLDLAAVSFGLLVALAIDPPPPSVLTLQRDGVRPVAAAAIVVLALLAAFINTVHVGHEIRDTEVGAFRSRYTAAMLQQMAAERARTWKEGLPLTTSRFAREDHYLTEARWHVQERNEAAASDDTLTAWRENRILEKYYAPLLELPAVNAEYRWSAEQRALAAAAAATTQHTPYESRAHALPIYVFSP